MSSRGLLIFGVRPLCATLVLFMLLVANSCLPQSSTTSGGRSIAVYDFSVMKESLEKAIFPAFIARWKQERGEQANFTSSSPGCETITNQILQGVGADVAILSIERDVDRLKQGGAVTSDWHTLPAQGIVNKMPLVILVRRGNPKGIRDFPELGRPAVSSFIRTLSLQAARCGRYWPSTVPS